MLLDYFPDSSGQEGMTLLPASWNAGKNLIVENSKLYFEILGKCDRIVYGGDMSSRKYYRGSDPKSGAGLAHGWHPDCASATLDKR